MIHWIHMIALLGVSPVAYMCAADDVIAPHRMDTRAEVSRETFGGEVRAVTKDTITIYCPAQEIQALRVDTDGTKTTLVVMLPSETRTYKMSAVLAAGGYHKTFLSGNTYRLKDVEVGDIATIMWSRSKGVEQCESICISRRPGGRVPPASGEEPDAKRPWHEWMNALQDFEEKGIQVPDRFLSPWDLEARYAHVAPMPRPARPRIPPAKD